MTINEYQNLAMRTLNPELSRRDVLINSVMGLCGESGEAIDILPRSWGTSPGIWRRRQRLWTFPWRRSFRATLKS